MALEVGTYISDLVSTNPTHTDGIDNADGHLRWIKTAILATFPNITGAVTLTQAALNALSGLVNATLGTLTAPIPTGSSTVGGSLVLKGAGSNPDITLTNAGPGLAVSANTTEVAGIDGSGNITFVGSVNASSIIQGGNVLIPRGMIMLWAGSVASIPTGWLLCNGSSGTPDLRDRFVVCAGVLNNVSATGGLYGYNTTTDSQGAHTHGGATVAAGGHSHSASTDTQGAHSHGGATASHTLTVAELPAHSHEQQTGQGTGGSLGNSWNIAGNATSINDSGFATQNQGSNNGHSHGINSDGSHSHNVNVTGVGDHQHSINSDGNHFHSITVSSTPPFYALAYVMKT